LRRDPDFLLVGEIRDKASAAAMVNGVQTGHPVMTTVHAQSAVEIVERMAGPGMDVPPQTLGSPNFISALCYQMLLPRLDDASKVRVTKDNMHELLGPDLTTRILEVCPNVDQANIHIRGNSNPEYPLGIAGMTICAEVISPDYKMREHFRRLEITEALAHWRKSGEQHRRQQGKRLDNQVVGFSALDHAIFKMLEGMIDPRDVEYKFGMINMQNIMRDGVFEEDEAGELFSYTDHQQEALNGFVADAGTANGHGTDLPNLN
jgi:type II secretory ATPase GspE/PulE/Tfp pilus assembly ATPase PilB-like protein